jgi:cobalamin biosynthesis protein CbiM
MIDPMTGRLPQFPAFALVLGLYLAIPNAAFAHYSMVLPQATFGRLGEPVTIIYQWGHPFEHQLSDAPLPAAFTIFTPSGNKTEANKDIKAFELPKADGKKVRAFRIQFTPKERGDFVFVLRTPPIWMEEDAAFVEDTVQVVLHVQVQQGWDAATGGKMEITPLTRPYGLQAGMVFQARFRADGKALAGALVEIERYNSAAPAVLPLDEHITRTVKSDADGVVTASLMEPGWWGLTASRQGGKKDHEGKMYPIHERVTLWVFVDDPKSIRPEAQTPESKTENSKSEIRNPNLRAAFIPLFAAYPLLAVHISDGNVLTPGWLVGGYLLAVILMVFGSWRIQDEEIPRVALLTSAFFVVSMIHVPVPGLPTSAHLLLNGLLGVVLGRRAALAIPIGLFLQAVLLQHGGVTTLGVNSCVMTLPALLAWQVFLMLQCLPDRVKMPNFVIGMVVGGSAVLATVFLHCLALLWGGTSDWRSLIVLTLIPHLIIAAVEGVVLGFTVRFLARVKPDMLRGQVTRESSECLADAQSQMA